MLTRTKAVIGVIGALVGIAAVIGGWVAAADIHGKFQTTDKAQKDHAEIRGEIAKISGQIMAKEIRDECRYRQRTYRELGPQIITFGMQLDNLANEPETQQRKEKQKKLENTITQLTTLQTSLLSTDENCRIGIFRGDPSL